MYLMNDEENNNANAKEPFSNYGKRIQIFSSFEEEEQSKLIYAASLTLMQCLTDLRKLINHSYGITPHSIIPEKRKITIIYHQ